MVTVPGTPSSSPVHRFADQSTETVSISGSEFSQPSFVLSNERVNANNSAWTSEFPASSGSQSGAFVANSSQNKSMGMRSDFWRSPDKGSSLRPTKRPSAFSSNGSGEGDMPPEPKIRITEEKMLARLRNFHITSAADNVDSSWFFMQKPLEMFDDIENRMSDEDGDGEENHHITLTRNNINADTEADLSDDERFQERKALEASGVLKLILDADRKRAVALAPSPCTDIVLWKPPDDFLKQIVPDDFDTPASPDILRRSQSDDRTSMTDVEFIDTHLTVPDSVLVDRPAYSESSLSQRRNARQYSKPIFDVSSLPGAGDNTAAESGCDAKNTFDPSSVMDVD